MLIALDKVRFNMAKRLVSFCSLFDDMAERAFVVTLTGERLALGEKVTALPFRDFVKRDYI
ncbi:MAG: hypothetical protein RDV48_28005 [Candidatus Eremiobacteraeota bacterium]|nr:hypothetical protein [Candidatus Eremiobacteraeota bacterium]